MPSNDLSDLFGAQPAGPSMDVRYRQGIINTFDPTTMANTVDVGGTLLTNLPLLGVGEATLLAPGSVVGIAAIISDKGTATWAILGRMVLPNTADVTDVATLLAQGVVSQQISGIVGTASTSYVDLGGPSVTVRVRASGSILVAISAEVQATKEIGIMSFQMTGTNTQAPDDELALYTYAEGIFLDVAASRIVQVDGLLPGETTVSARYHIGGVGAPGGGVQWANRAITVFAL